ncbi:MAG: hypothetical protein LBU65_07900 [Planctomycetaceae bacterium]|nr:hypothetical protein [Planctomycetaceae bacterium]
MFKLNNVTSIIAILAIFAQAIGCASLPNSGIDPSGERIFSRSLSDSCPLKSPFEDCALFGKKKAAPFVPSAASPSPDSTASTTGNGLPGISGAYASGNYSTTTTTSPNRTGSISTAMIPEATDGVGAARPIVPIQGPALVMTPREQIAPVGSEVILVSSFLGNDQYLRTNEPVEWSLDGVGHIFSIDPGHICDPLLFDYKTAKKSTDKFALTKTSSHEQTIRRGTTDPRDDIRILRGQSWVSVNATKEGSTYVTAVATNMKDWSKRSDSATIHWVDAEWILPPTTIAVIGSTRTLTTTVRHKSNGVPRTGWVVRYEILGGPAAGFGTARTQRVDVETNADGQAAVELSQVELLPGTNAISIKVIRPASSETIDRPVTLANENWRQVWASGNALTIAVTGPPTMKLGGELPYKITVTNNGTASTGAVLALPVPSGMRYMRAVPLPIPSSIPSSAAPAAPLQWELADIRPNESRVVDVTLVAEARGTYSVIPQVYQKTIYGTVTTPPVTRPTQTAPPVSPFPSTGSTPSTTAPPSVVPFDGIGSTKPQPNNLITARFRKLTTSDLQADELKAMKEGLPVGAGMSAYALDVTNVSGRDLSNVKFRVYAIPDRMTANFCTSSSGASYLNGGTPSERIEMLVPTLQANGTASIRCGFHILKPLNNQTLRGEALIDDRVLETPTIEFTAM